jgi:hypothetical protein
MATRTRTWPAMVASELLNAGSHSVEAAFTYKNAGTHWAQRIRDGVVELRRHARPDPLHV